MFYLLLCFLFISATGASTDSAANEEIPLESIKDALRQVFRIPDKVPTSPHRPSGRSLRFMMQLYKKITSGESQFPKDANTVRSIAPIEDIEQRHSLLFNLTTSQDERIISSYLHITGHRRPTHPSRIAFYLEPPSAEAGEKPPNTKELKDEPLMVVFVKKQPLDIDASRITKKALEYNPPLLIRILEEQLRRGKWVASPTRRLTKKSPILIIVSADPHILDIEAFGVGALRLGRMQKRKDHIDNKYKNVNLDRELSTHEKIGGFFNEGLRSKRSLRGKNSFEFDGNKFPPLERGQNFITETEIKPQGKSSKDTYWIQKQTLDTDSSVEDENIFLNEFESKIKFDYDINSPMLTNSFGSRVEPYQTKPIQNVTSKVSFNNFNQKISAQNREEKQSSKTEERELLLKSDTKAKSKMESHATTSDVFGDEDDESHLLLLPLKEYKPLPKSERKRLKKKNKKKSDLIPYPDYYASWDNWDWDYQESPSWKRKSRKGKKNKRVKERKAKGISDRWISSGMQNRLSNAAAPVHEPFNGKCQKHSNYVDFKILGWADKFIVAPSGFETYFCSGGCPTPLSSIEAGSNHAIIQSLLRASNLSPELPNPCCVPARLDSLSILMVEEDGRIALKTLPNMVVKSCSCQ